MTVQRFNPVASAAISLSEQGEYVKYADYEKLAAKLSIIKDLMEAAEQANKLAQEATEKLVQERDALAAENAGLKAAHPQPFGPEMMKALDAYEKHQDEVPETGMLNAFFILRDSIRVETPATDAFLAEVRAQARTDFIGRIEWIIRNECNPEKTETIINELQAFAAQLRKDPAQ